QQELAAFIKSKEVTVDGKQGHDFDGDSIKALADRNDELNALADELKSAESIEGALNGAISSMAANREVVNRLPFSAEGGSGYSGAAVKGIGDYFTESDALKCVSGM